MGKYGLAALALCCARWAGADALRPLDDQELAKVSGGDGIDFAAHVVLIDPTLALGLHGDGQMRYIVLKNVRGTVDLFALSAGVQKKPDGSDYMAIGLPGYVKYGNFGFESLSVQNDPLAPVTGNLGSMNVNGTITLQGQFRLWTH
ncbi:hypothetical protein AAKU55_001190 [Oxalobacteraceae bacterium GrIS 1.11]